MFLPFERWQTITRSSFVVLAVRAVHQTQAADRPRPARRATGNGTVRRAATGQRSGRRSERRRAAGSVRRQVLRGDGRRERRSGHAGRRQGRRLFQVPQPTVQTLGRRAQRNGRR